MLIILVDILLKNKQKR